MNLQQNLNALILVACEIAESYYFAGKVGTAINLIGALIDSLPHEDLSRQSHVQLGLAKSRFLNKQMFLIGLSTDTVLPFVEHVLDLALQTDDALLQAEAHDLMGEAQYFIQLANIYYDFTTAQSHFTEAQKLLEGLDAPAPKSTNLFHIGLIHQFRKEPEQAKEYFEKAYQLAKQHNLPLEQSYASRHLGFIQRDEGDLAGALANLQESLQLRQDIGYQVCLPFSTISVADVQGMLDDKDSADKNYQLALEQAQIVRNVRAMMLANYGLGNLHQSREHFQQAIHMAVTIGHQAMVSAATAQLDNLT